jgi:hypothetical protein
LTSTTRPPPPLSTQPPQRPPNDAADARRSAIRRGCRTPGARVVVEIRQIFDKQPTGMPTPSLSFMESEFVIGSGLINIL